MVMMKYNIPLPNNGERYDLSKEELVKILDAAYNNGWNHGYGVAEIQYNSHTAYASYENMNDNTRWKEIRLNE